MTSSPFPHPTRIDALLTTVAAEQYLRSPLLSELAHELASAGLAAAASAAERLASAAPERMADSVFVAEVRALAELVRAAN